MKNSRIIAILLQTARETIATANIQIDACLGESDQQAKENLSYWRGRRLEAYNTVSVIIRNWD